jgi:hypothetical protein
MLLKLTVDRTALSQCSMKQGWRTNFRRGWEGRKVKRFLQWQKNTYLWDIKEKSDRVKYDSRQTKVHSMHNWSIKEMATMHITVSSTSRLMMYLHTLQLIYKLHIPFLDKRGCSIFQKLINHIIQQIPTLQKSFFF